MLDKALTWIIAALTFFLVGTVAVAYLYGVSLRDAGIIEGKNALRIAAKDYAEHGYVTNYGGGYEISLASNLVSIGGTQFQCFITTHNNKFADKGTLAMTTNKMFIWLDSQRPPKIIGTDYRAPIFPPRF